MRFREFLLESQDTFVATKRIAVFVPRYGHTYDAADLDQVLDKTGATPKSILEVHGFIYTDDEFFIVSNQNYCTFPPEYVLVGQKNESGAGFHRVIIRRSDIQNKAITKAEHDRRFLDNLRDDE
jgi:hypothetical protein